MKAEAECETIGIWKRSLVPEDGMHRQGSQRIANGLLPDALQSVLPRDIAPGGGFHMLLREEMLYSGIMVGAALPVCAAAIAGSGCAKEMRRRRRSMRLRRKKKEKTKKQ